MKKYTQFQMTIYLIVAVMFTLALSISATAGVLKSTNEELLQCSDNLEFMVEKHDELYLQSVENRQ